jgi:hypothetical protein
MRLDSTTLLLIYHLTLFRVRILVSNSAGMLNYPCNEEVSRWPQFAILIVRSDEGINRQ